MTHRKPVYRVALLAALCSGAALAQPAHSPVGTWRSGLITNELPRVSDTVELTLTQVEAHQRVVGHFVAFETNWGMPSVPRCRSGPVSGTFDGTILRVVSQATALCPERVFDLRIQEQTLSGKYKGEVGGFLDVTFTRKL